MDLNALQKALGYTFTNLDLLRTALLHRSYIHEHHEVTLPSNERLEFLGDALLNFICGAFLFTEFPQLGEGDLTKHRAALVQTKTLAMFARQFDLGKYIQISRGEDRANARNRDNLLADGFEALLAAIALDADWQTARDFVLPLLREAMANGVNQTDYKSELQHVVQGASNITPNYREVSVRGPHHDREWTVEVLVQDVLLGTGVGKSKTNASQEAARLALESLNSDNPPQLPKLNAGDESK